MRLNPAATLDWNALAEIACMSRYHFLRIFEQLTGASPHRFLMALRIEKAKQLLLQTKMDVNDVCKKVGYSSVGSFIRVFKELVGIAPGGFRGLAGNMTQLRLERLLEEHLAKETRYYLGTTLRADLEVAGSFDGIIFVGLFNSQLQPLAPFVGAFTRQSRALALALTERNVERCLLAIGFSDEMDVSHYFLPGPQSHVAISSMIPPCSSDDPGKRTVFLKLQPPSIFNLPILACLPLLFLKLGDTEKSGPA